MLGTSLDFEFQNNAPWRYNYQMMSNGVPVDLTGASLHMQLRQTADSDVIELDLSTDNGLLKIIDAPNGIWGFNVDVITSLNTDAGSYVHDMIVKTASGNIFVAYTGQATIDQGVTRDTSQWMASQ